MKTVACFNIKGGVGKTAAAVNLAWLAARDGVRTLLWDLDPQGAASFYFRIQTKLRGGVGRLVKKRSDLLEHVRASDFARLDVVPADFSIRKLDRVLDTFGKPRRRLARLLAPLADEYDLVLLDCAPSMSLASEAVFESANALLTPTIPTPLAMRTRAQLERHLARLDSDRTPQVLPFFSMVDKRKALHRQICAQADQEQLGFLEARIPQASAVEQMGLHRAPLHTFAAKSEAARAFERLWAEVRERVDVQRPGDAG